MDSRTANENDVADAAPLVPQRDQLRTLLENVPALVLTVDLDGRIVFVNRAHLRFTVEQLTLIGQ